MDEIDVECASANQLKASAIPCILREMLLMDSEEGETDHRAGNTCRQIGDILDAWRRQENRPDDDGSE